MILWSSILVFFLLKPWTTIDECLHSHRFLCNLIFLFLHDLKFPHRLCSRVMSELCYWTVYNWSRWVARGVKTRLQKVPNKQRAWPEVGIMSDIQENCKDGHFTAKFVMQHVRSKSRQKRHLCKSSGRQHLKGAYHELQEGVSVL